MYPSKSVIDYMSEINRMFSNNGENDIDQQANTSNSTLFNQSATNMSSSTNSTSPESFSDTSIHRLFYDPDFPVSRQHLYDQESLELHRQGRDAPFKFSYHHELYDSPIRRSSNSYGHYRSESSTTSLASISQWHDEYKHPVVSQNRSYQELFPVTSQQLCDKEYPITRPKWLDQSTDNLGQWSDFNSPLTMQTWQEHDSPIRRQRPIVGRRLMTNENKLSEPVKFDPAIWRNETPSKVNNMYVEQRNYAHNAKYELFPENVGFDVKSVQSCASSISPISNVSKSNVSPVTNIGHFEQNIIPRFSTPLPPSLLPISGGKLCTFCRKNGETPSVYLTHNVKEKLKNKYIVTCPILRSHVCSTCGVSGDMAHTITYCPVLRSSNNGQPLPSTTITLKNTRIQSNGKRRY